MATSHKTVRRTTSPTNKRSRTSSATRRLPLDFRLRRESFPTACTWQSKGWQNCSRQDGFHAALDERPRQVARQGRRYARHRIDQGESQACYLLEGSRRGRDRTPAGITFNNGRRTCIGPRVWRPCVGNTAISSHCRFRRFEGLMRSANNCQ